jgi:predicted O-methyltransferase YrrM
MGHRAKLALRDARNRFTRFPAWRAAIRSALQDPGRHGTPPEALRAALTAWADREPPPAEVRAAFARIERERLRLVNDDSQLLRNGRTTSQVAFLGSNPVVICELLWRVSSATQPTEALELGTLLGVSSAYLALGLPPGGRLVTVEYKKALAARSRVFLRDCGLDSRVVVMRADFNKESPDFALDGGYQLLYKDGAHTEQATLDFLHRCREWASPGATLIFDDLDRPELAGAWNQVDSLLDVTFQCSTGRTGIAVLAR